jgi:hypothetical protein
VYLANSTEYAFRPDEGQICAGHDASRELLLQYGLLRVPEADVFAIKPILGRAGFPAADHILSPNQLATGDETHSAAAGAGHHGHVWVLRLTKLGLVLKHKNCSGVHSFGNPFFQKLQVG